jgi:wyosine [tRNA(Phe)-imidazoG37] synthetase (radical SAM superfamily)
MRIYGPIPSRRFGLSLGVDVLPHKTCSMDCIYCQLGPSDRVEIEQRTFFPVEDILKEVAQALERGPGPDVITLAGSGEPTLYRPLGALIDGLHDLANIPILIITNSTMLHVEETARAVMKAEILAPSLDAGDEETFRKVNQTHAAISFKTMFEGLKRVTHAHPGQIHLEVMLVEGVNDSEESLVAIAEKISEIRFDRIDINTPVRPPVPERGALPCSEEVLARAVELFGDKAHPIADFRPTCVRPLHPRAFSDRDKDIREMLLRRPCTVRDIASGLSLSESRVLESLNRMLSLGVVEAKPVKGAVYFQVQSANPSLRKKNESQ